MALVSMSGALTIFISEERVKKILVPLVAFASGTLLAGAFFHLIPEAVEVSFFGVFLFWEPYLSLMPTLSNSFSLSGHGK